MASAINAGDLNSPGGDGFFSIDKVQLMFSLTDIAFLKVSNNILCMALNSGKIIRIDLDHPEVVDEAEIPKRTGELTAIAGIFLDPTGSHLITTTKNGDNYILNYRSTKPRLLSRLKGNVITAIAWSPNEPSRSTGAILVGTSTGVVYETLIESSNEYFKKEEKYFKQVWKDPMNNKSKGIKGIYAYESRKGGGSRQVVLCTDDAIYSFQGKISSKGLAESSPVYARFFDKSDPIVEVFGGSEATRESFAVSPASSKANLPDQFAWANGTGIMHGELYPEDYSTIFSGARLLLNDQIVPPNSVSKAVGSITLSQYYLFILNGFNISIFNRLNGKLVFNESIELETGEKIWCLTSDVKYATFWLYTTHNIYEIRMNDDEGEQIWKTFLENGDFSKALECASTSYAKDIVRIAYGEDLFSKGMYRDAANMLGLSSKPFDSVAVELLDKDQDALLIFIKLRLGQLDAKATMQQTILTSWVIELYMEKLNDCDNQLAAAGFDSNAAKEAKKAVEKEFKSFLDCYKDVLDKATVYEIISSHGKREELLYFASCISDVEYVLRYWVAIENWGEALSVLRHENDSRLAYKYSSVLLLNAPKETVETWMRLSDIEPSRLLPALLTYSSRFKATPESNQAIRFLKYAINTMKVQDPVIYNTLISIYASSPGIAEATLLEFFEKHSTMLYDSDFALRMCVEFERIECSTYIMCSIRLFEDALNLALSRNMIGLAKQIADKPVDNPPLRKALWLQIAQKVMQTGRIRKSGKQADGNKSDLDHSFAAAVQLLGECELLQIEDLLPFSPPFKEIGELKKEFISSVERYFASINQLNQEMEDSIETGRNVQKEIDNFKKRYVLIEPGEKCGICDFPLATRKFYVFPCQHAFHSDCLAADQSQNGEYKVRQKIAEITAKTAKKDLADALDEVLSTKCILCSFQKIEELDVPLVSQTENANAWAI